MEDLLRGPFGDDDLPGLPGSDDGDPPPDKIKGDLIVFFEVIDIDMAEIQDSLVERALSGRSGSHC